MLEVKPIKQFDGNFAVPVSKPETQRAMLVSALANGQSSIYSWLECEETNAMKKACAVMGASFSHQNDCLTVQGNHGCIDMAEQQINCGGSALIFRVFSALSSFSKTPTLLTGDSTLEARIMQPLFVALEKLGAKLRYLKELYQAPVVNDGSPLKGGHVCLPGDVSSQFITAMLFAAPFAEDKVEISIKNPIYSLSYIKQTTSALRKAGISFWHNEAYDYFTVEPSCYKPNKWKIYGDYTSASYLLAARALFPGRSIFYNLSPESLQGEKFILNILEELGLKIKYLSNSNAVLVENELGTLKGNYEFNVMDCPNILPTLAAIGAYVQGRFRVIGGDLTTYHKCNRIQSIITELTKFGVHIKPIESCKGRLHGFEIQGKASYPGGVILSGHNDHRMLMSLYVMALRAKTVSYIAEHKRLVCASYPEFLDLFNRQYDEKIMSVA